MSISVQAPTGARPSWALLYFNFSKDIKDKTHKFQQLFLSINYYFAYSIVEIYAFFGGEDQTDPRFVCGGPNSISRTGPFGPSSKILGSPSQLDKAKLLLPVVYNYTTFRAMMSKDYPEIQHQFDPWHWIKVI